MTLLTIDVNSYVSRILLPFFLLFDKQWSEANRVDMMHFKPGGSIQRIIHTLWFSLRTLKREDQLANLFNQTILWRSNDEQFIQSLKPPVRPALVKIRKRRPLMPKTGKNVGNEYQTIFTLNCESVQRDIIHASSSRYSR